jgi:hypothetical protein
VLQRRGTVGGRFYDTNEEKGEKKIKESMMVSKYDVVYNQPHHAFSDSPILRFSSKLLQIYKK